jgi:hypothetical protein
VSNAFGLVFFAVYCLAVVGAAAGITWLVVRYSPTKRT